jgi:hypothetical protein
MSQVTIESELAERVKRLTAKQGIDEGIKDLLIDKARREILKYDLVIKDFEQKYGMSFNEFKDSELMRKPRFEVEQDYFDWEMAITVIEDTREELDKLRPRAE